MSQRRGRDATDQVVWPFIQLLLELLGYLIFGVFIVCQWLTRMLFEYLLNPLTEGAFDRHDGAVVLTSAGLWGIVFGGIVLPLAISQGWMVVPATQVDNSVGMMVVAGLLWGGVIGGFLVLTWWNEIEARQPIATDFTQVNDTPQDGYTTGRQTEQQQGGLSLEEIEQLFLKQRWTEPTASSPPIGNDLPVPIGQGKET